MEKSQLFSHAELESILRRAGYPQDQIDALLRDLPDPVDLEQYREEFFKRGLSLGALMDRRGGSP